MPAPVRGRDLVLDQRVDGLGVGHAQQRLGKAHQRDALIGRKPVFGQKHFHQPGPPALADVGHQICGLRDDVLAVARTQGRHIHQPRNDVGL